jgi:hypothetical protein
VYYVSLTYVDSNGGESTPSAPARLYIPANSVLVVNPPTEPISAGTSGVQYSNYNVYAAESVGGAVLDTSDLSLQTTGTNLLISAGAWTEPNTGLTTGGVNPPVDNTLEPIAGYLIEFRYFRLRAPVISATQVLQIPDDYQDVVVAGVNAFTASYLARPAEAQKWYALYKDGIQQIVRDINFMARGGEYIQPDPTSVGGFLPTVETIDLGNLSN